MLVAIVLARFIWVVLAATLNKGGIAAAKTSNRVKATSISTKENPLSLTRIFPKKLGILGSSGPKFFDRHQFFRQAQLFLLVFIGFFRGEMRSRQPVCPSSR